MLRPRPWRRLSTPRSRCLGLDRTGGRRRRCRGRRPGGSPSPRQQLVDALCRVGGDAREDVAQIARGGRKSKTVAGRQGRAVGDRPADPVCEKRHDPYGCPDRRDSREHQGVGLDDAGAGGRGWRSDCGPRQDTRRRSGESPANRDRGRSWGEGDKAVRAGKKIARIALAFEAGRDGFWLARWPGGSQPARLAERLRRLCGFRIP
jgi:hypothetical protein